MPAKKTKCEANVGTRQEPRPCGQPIADGMKAACKAHATKMIQTGTPGIYYRGGGYIVVTRHRGKQVKSFHRKMEEARETKGDRTGSQRQTPPRRRAFDDYSLEWIKNYQGHTSRGFDEVTRKSYARAFRLYAIPHFGSCPLRDIDRGDVKRLVAKLQAQGLSPRSVAAYIAPLRAMFSDAVEDGHMLANPALSLKINAKARSTRLEAQPERAKEMTRGELAAVLHWIPERPRLVFEIMAHTGCRISEALGLDWGDVTFGDEPTLAIRRQWYRGNLKTTKTAAGQRVVALSDSLAAKLWELGADATGPIVCTRSGQRYSDRNLSRVLNVARKRAGVPGVTHHTFRHTHGSILLDEGWTIAEVADRLGHADPSITARVYAHKMRDRRRELGFLDDLMGSTSSSEMKEPDDPAHEGWATAGQHNTREQPQIAS